VGTCAFLLAEAGLLDGRSAVTHWARCGELARRFPSINVRPKPIFVHDGRVWSSAGVTAGMDLCLALVEEDVGRDIALAVARDIVMFLKRPGDRRSSARRSRSSARGSSTLSTTGYAGTSRASSRSRSSRGAVG
jgi:transcriptional regulator GlxA family with amidase domain